MGKLTTHVLDLVSGGPAAGMEIVLSRDGVDGRFVEVKRVRTNSDGRTDEPLLEGAEFDAGGYELAFGVGEYFGMRGTPQASPPFLGVVPVRFTVSDVAAAHHVPLLCTPWAYQTYRGS